MPQVQTFSSTEYSAPAPQPHPIRYRRTVGVVERIGVRRGELGDGLITGIGISDLANRCQRHEAADELASEEGHTVLAEVLALQLY